MAMKGFQEFMINPDRLDAMLADDRARAARIYSRLAAGRSRWPTAVVPRTARRSLAVAAPAGALRRRAAGAGLPPVRLFVLYPIAASVALSFQDWDGVGVRRWVGLANYRRARPATRCSAPRSRTTSPGSCSRCWRRSLGLALALFLNQRAARHAPDPRAVLHAVRDQPGRRRPRLRAGSSTRRFGLLSASSASRAGPVAPLDSEHWRDLYAVIVAGLWPQTAYCLILYLAGLTTLRPRADRRRARSTAPAAGRSAARRAAAAAAGHLHRRDGLRSSARCAASTYVVIMTARRALRQLHVLAYYMYEQTFLSSALRLRRGDRDRAVRC